MNSFDHSLKYLVGREPADFISFGLGGAPVEILGPVSTALPARGRDLDAAFLVSVEGDVLVSHLEYHRRHQAHDELALDIAEAQVRLFRREGRPVLSHVWDLYGSEGAPLLEDRVLGYGRTSGGQRSQSVYRRINLRALRAQELLCQAPPALWPLSPLTADGASIETVRLARDAIEGRTDLSESLRADHLAVLLFMGAAEGLPMAALRAYIPKDMMMDSPIYREIFEEGEAKGEAKGEVRGEVRGKAETLVKILIRRFNHVDDLLNQRIQAEGRLEILDAWLDEAVLASDDRALHQLVDHIKRTPVQTLTPPTP